MTKGAANHVELNQRPEVPMFNKFSDVLLKELSVMLPDQDIKSMIELVPILLLCIRDPIGRLLSN
jgi:hypothetical protein